ncbi:hypothetical protein BOTBODRAFT_572583 [Botryobasidium botryosum FD-172 SS1]|uniref:Uncharacterized protein n=1 Tax=Botryobasidium botryosum (strain FD-172 SS1) TaxID=930990 RepID=A0A067LXQ3_BOTB1|nr:hypothetical protein BOTBODRAFT_572583 [Botryobasidium botryosum FD-172 SS1]
MHGAGYLEPGPHTSVRHLLLGDDLAGAPLGQSSVSHEVAWRVLLKVVRGEHPSRSEHDCAIHDGMWALFGRCSSSDPKARSTIQEIVSEIEVIRTN